MAGEARTKEEAEKLLSRCRCLEPDTLGASAMAGPAQTLVCCGPRQRIIRHHRLPSFPPSFFHQSSMFCSSPPFLSFPAGVYYTTTKRTFLVIAFRCSIFHGCINTPRSRQCSIRLYKNRRRCCSTKAICTQSSKATSKLPSTRPFWCSAIQWMCFYGSVSLLAMSRFPHTRSEKGFTSRILCGRHRHTPSVRNERPCPFIAFDTNPNIARLSYQPLLQSTFSLGKF